MDIREQIIVNGSIPVKLHPYTELRHEKIQEVEADIDKFTEENPQLTFQDMKRDKKAEFWMRKAKILWEPVIETDDKGNPISIPDNHWDKNEKFFTKEFFMDKAFEYTLLRKSQDFFLMQEVFL